MSKKLLLLLIVLSSSFIVAKAQNWQWAIEGTGTFKADDFGAPVATDKKGYAYATGSYSSIITFGSYTLTNSMDGVFLVKVDASGTALWAKQPLVIGIKGYSYGLSVATDSSDNSFITGFYDGGLLFGKDTLFCNGTSAFLAKYNPAGNIVWARQPITNLAEGEGVATDYSGNAFITGFCADTTRFGNILLGIPKPNKYAYCVKYDKSGTVLWAKQATTLGAAVSFGKAINTDIHYNCYITGGFADTNVFGNDTLASPTARYDAFVVKYDSAGNTQWARQSAEISKGKCKGSGVATDKTGNVYVTGLFNDTVNFGSQQLAGSSVSSYDQVFLVKYDPNGNVLWAMQTKDNGACLNPAISADAFGHLYLSFISRAPFPVIFNGKPVPGNAQPSTYLLKMDTSGNVICSSYFNIPYTPYEPSGVASDSSGNYIYVGGTLIGNTAIGPDTLTGNMNPMVARWKGCCRTGSGKTDTVIICYGNSVTLSAPSGGTYMWNNGYTTDTITVIPYDSITYTAKSNIDGCIIDTSVKVIVNRARQVWACCNDTMVKGDSVQLSMVEAKAGETFQWIPSSWLSCDTCMNPVAKPPSSTWYYMIYTDVNGCSSKDSVFVTVENPVYKVDCGQLFVPNAFSPNGDGQNDVLYVRGNCITAMVFDVYDRWGNKVFESENQSVGWDGTYQGQPMNTGTFTYDLKVLFNDNTSQSKRGSVTLVR